MRDLRFEYERRIWELEHKAKPEAEPSLVSEVVDALGGPETVQGLVGAAMAGMSAGRSAPKAPRQRMAPPRAPQAVPQAQAPGPHPATSPRTNQFEAYRAAGLAEGSLGRWLAARPQLGAGCDQIIRGLDTEEAEEDAPGAEGAPSSPPSPEDLKALLVRRLDEGAEADAILQELRGQVGPAALAQLQAVVGSLPDAMLGTLLGAPQHQARLVELRERMMAA